MFTVVYNYVTGQGLCCLFLYSIVLYFLNIGRMLITYVFMFFSITTPNTFSKLDSTRLSPQPKLSGLHKIILLIIRILSVYTHLHV